MGGMSLWHWIIVIGVFLLLFGGGSRFSSMMGDVAKGLKSFKKGMADDDEPVVAPRRLENDAAVDAAAAERLRAAEPVDRRDP